MEHLNRPRNPQGGDLGAPESEALRRELANHDVETGDRGESDADGDAVRRRRRKLADKKRERRLEEMRQGEFADPAQCERRQRDAELRGGNVRVQVPDDGLRGTAPARPSATS